MFAIDENYSIYVHDKVLFNGFVIRINNDINLQNINSDESKKLAGIVIKIVNYLN